MLQSQERKQNFRGTEPENARMCVTPPPNPGDRKLGGRRSCGQPALGMQSPIQTQLKNGCHPSPPLPLPTTATSLQPVSCSGLRRVKASIEVNLKCGFLSETAHSNFVIETHLMPKSGHLK